MSKISLSKIIFFILILIFVIISIFWDNSYKFESVFLVLLSVNLFIMIFEDKKRGSR